MNTSDEARDPKDEDGIIRFLEVQASLLHTRQGICKLASDIWGHRMRPCIPCILKFLKITHFKNPNILKTKLNEH